MARGFRRSQIGVTEEMLESFGETVFRLSHNIQIRRGDPVRELNWEQLALQREGMGLSDQQIADKIGMTRDQVLYIRTVMERRKFRTSSYTKLLELGGGKRYRAERYVPHGDRPAFSEAALELRSALRYPPALAKRYIDIGFWRDDTLGKWLAKHVAARPTAPAIRTLETTLTYKELAAQVDSLAGALWHAGIAKGDVVAVQLPNIPQFLVAYLAIAQLGAVMQTLHNPYRGAELETLLNHSRAKAYIGLGETKEFKPAAAIVELKPKLPVLKTVMSVGVATSGTLWLDAMIASGPALTEEEREDMEAVVASDPFLLLYTSGTTAAPKGVPLSYHNMLSNARDGAPAHGIGPDDVITSAAPFTHLYGLYSFHVGMAVGACALLLPSFTPQDLATLVDRGKPTALWTAPAHLAACETLGLFDKHSFASLKLAIVSGSACPPDLIRRFAARMPNGAVTQLWGMTETQGALYSRPTDALEISATTAGRASPGTEIRIADPATDREVGIGVEGEIQVRGPLLFPGYYRNPAATGASFSEDHWFKSGDLGTKDAAGNVAITGRIKDVINRGGVKYNPRDVEDLLDMHPKIAQSAIVPMPDPVLGEKACCFVTPKPGQSVTLEEICDYLLARNIAKIKLPERLVIVAEMPMTPTRKIIKSKLKLPS
ncbi:MAG: class I adenylate-forming enzyme family protein [Alphaproteobacteria bacterium]